MASGKKEKEKDVVINLRRCRRRRRRRRPRSLLDPVHLAAAPAPRGRPLRPQKLHHGPRAHPLGLIKRGEAPPVSDAQVRAPFLGEHLDQSEVALGGADVEGSPVVVVAAVGRRARPEKPGVLFFNVLSGRVHFSSQIP